MLDYSRVDNLWLRPIATALACCFDVGAPGWTRMRGRGVILHPLLPEREISESERGDFSWHFLAVGSGPPKHMIQQPNHHHVVVWSLKTRVDHAYSLLVGHQLAQSLSMASVKNCHGANDEKPPDLGIPNIQTCNGFSYKKPEIIQSSWPFQTRFQFCSMG